ncbi:MAG: hypothetical protein JKY67_16660 [Pseudomonadales bacterium]|nr:hypothetical protein [Pseudomonadales bacterium]
MKSNNHLLSLAFVLSTSVWLSACGGGGGGSDSADAQLVEPEEPCTAREASEGLTGIWKIETFTKLFLQKAAGSIEDVGDLDPNKLINIGVMIFDKNETVTMTFCETDGVAELIREGNNLTTSTDVNELTGGDLFSGITVQNNDSIQLDINVPGFTELPIFLIEQT